MTVAAAVPATGGGGERRAALAAGVACYTAWGLFPLYFQLLGRAGIGPWEIVGHRTLWAVPAALALVLLARQGRELLAVLRRPRVLAWLALSTLLIGANWIVFVLAVNTGRTLDTSLGYYLNPLLNMAAGAVLFRERLDRLGWTAVALAAAGVVVQAFALGHLPWISLLLAFSFCAYGVVRKRVAVSAQTGLFVECLFFLPLSGLYVLWLQSTGAGRFLDSPLIAVLLLLSGPLTAGTLALFAWAARRLPYSTMGFLQFIAPTMTFCIGVAQGEPFTPLRALSFVLIWLGAALFAWGAWRRLRGVPPGAA